MEVDPLQDVSYDKVPPREEQPPEEPQDSGSQEPKEVPEEDGRGENVDFFA